MDGNVYYMCHGCKRIYKYNKKDTGENENLGSAYFNQNVFMIKLMTLISIGLLSRYCNSTPYSKPLCR